MEVKGNTKQGGIEPSNKDLHLKDITGYQATAYREFGKSNNSITLEQMAEIEVKAMTDAGIPEHYAAAWIHYALKDLETTNNITQVFKIPYKKL